MAALEYQKKLEGWIDDIVEILRSSLWTVAWLTISPFKSTLRFGFKGLSSN